jgi:transcription initiation factor IIE alpha subunit
MFYCTYREKTINILKCSKCRAYSILLEPVQQTGTGYGWTTYKYRCEKCGADGTVAISSSVNLESFEKWEELEERIEELKVAMSLGGLQLLPEDKPNIDNSL